MTDKRESGTSCKGILGALIDARAGSTFQLASYVAVARGLRPALDDFVLVSHYKEFTRIIEGIGLTHRADIVFGHVSDESKYPSLRFSPTTKAIGFPWDPKRQYGRTCEVHVFVGRGDEEIEAAWRSGWYPVVIGGRILPKPSLDHVRFGRSLGYPECCIAAFSRFNRWGRYDHISEAARESIMFPFVNNCFAKYTPYMLNFHIPCSFDCPRSRALGEAILKEVGGIDDRFAERIRSHLMTPVLHISERLNFGLIGATQDPDGRWRYAGVQDIYALITGRDRRHDILKSLLEWAGWVETRDTELIFWNTAGEQKTFECIIHEGVIENPRIFQFQE
jgi:hypothetical protein